MATSVATPLERRLGTIAGVNEMTSYELAPARRASACSSTSNRNIDGAAREVQAAINAARADLPATLRSNPTYRKANPADAPVIILALTSKTTTPGQIYDAVSNIVQQRLAQVEGVGDVEIGGGSLPAVRVELLPFALNRYGVSLEDVRAAIQAANANRPKGAIEGDGRRLQIYTQTPARRAADYRAVVVAWRNGAAVRLATSPRWSTASRTPTRWACSTASRRSSCWSRASPAPTSSRPSTACARCCPSCRRSCRRDVTLQVASDSTNSIRASLHEIEVTLLISIVLVVLVVSAVPAQRARDDRSRRWRPSSRCWAPSA